MAEKNVCVVTGASQGIGRATAVSLAATGEYSTMVLIARDRDGLAQTKQLIGSDANVAIYPFDLEKLEDIPALVAKVVNRHGAIDLLVNAAGFADPSPLFETSMASVEQTYRVNVFAPIALCKEVAKNMRARHSGKIVNIASTAGSSPRPGWVSYASSKAAVISVSKALSAELAEYGIKVYCVSPGRCATALRRKLAPEEDPSTIMQPEDVAAVIANLCSNAGNALDGQDIVVRQQPKRG